MATSFNTTATFFCLQGGCSTVFNGFWNWGQAWSDASVHFRKCQIFTKLAVLLWLNTPENMKLCTPCIKSELLGNRQTCKVSETWLVSTVGPQTFLHRSCMSSWNLKEAIHHVELCWTRENRLYLLNSSSNLLIIVYLQSSFLIVMPCNRMMLNDVVVSVVWTGPRYTVSKLSDSAAIQWINNYIYFTV